MAAVRKRISKRPRWSAKRFYLTFPKCTTEPQTAVDNARKVWDDLEWCVVGREKHEDGDLHLHVAMSFTAKKDFRASTWADIMTGTHGNYQTMTSLRKCLAYVTKDGNFVEWGIKVSTVLSKQSTLSAQVEKSLEDGTTLADIRTKFPGYLSRNLRNLEYYIDWTERTKIQLREVKWGSAVESGPPSSATAEIVSWLNLNICRPRTFKQPQLWVWGDTNLGKSTLIKALSEQIRIYFAPLDENFYNGWSDSTYDCVVFDEFKGQKSITWMNTFLQGSPMSIAVKGNQRLKKDNIPVIVLSNFSLEDCYWKQTLQSVGPLAGRLQIVHVSEFINIEFR